MSGDEPTVDEGLALDADVAAWTTLAVAELAARTRILEEWRTRELVRAERRRDIRRRVPGRVLRLVERMLGPRP